MLKERFENILHKTKRSSYAGILAVSSLFTPAIYAKAQTIQNEMSPPYCTGQAQDNTIIQSATIEHSPTTLQNPEVVFTSLHDNYTNSQEIRFPQVVYPDSTTNQQYIKQYKHRKHSKIRESRYQLHIDSKKINPPAHLHTTREIQAYVRHATDNMWDDGQWLPVFNIVYCESRWNPTAGSKFGPYGLFQDEAGFNGDYSIPHQVYVGLNYIKDTYATPAKAWVHWQQWSSY